MNEQNESKSLGRLVANLESDPDIQAAIQAKLAAQGLAVEDPGVKAFQQRAMQIAREARACYEATHATPPPVAARSNIIERAMEHVGVAANRIKRYCDLSFFQPQFAAGGNLASPATADEEKAREIVLAEELTESELSRIPWTGPKVKLSKTAPTAIKPAIYHAYVTSIHKNVPQNGTLRIVLIAPDGQTAEARLKSDDRNKMFQGDDLPADSRELRYALLVER